MSQQAAEHFKVTTIDQIKGCKGVPEQMRMKPLNTAALLKVLKSHLYNVDVNAVAAAVKEKRSGYLAGTLGSGRAKIIVHTTGGNISHRYKPLLAAFTVYKNALLSEIHIGNLKTAQLGTAKPAIEHKQGKALVAKLELVGGIEAVQKPLNFLIGKGNYFLFLLLYQLELTGAIADYFLVNKVIVKRLDRPKSLFSIFTFMRKGGIMYIDWR